VVAVAHWCGHCKALEPALNAFGATAKSNAFRLGRINCEDELDLCTQLGVKSFPHIFLVQGAQFFMFNGPDRSEKSLRDFAALDLSSVDSNHLTLPKPPLELPKQGVSVVLDERTFDEATMRGVWVVIFRSTCKPCDVVVS
jgi:hypothetical protein